MFIVKSCQCWLKHWLTRKQYKIIGTIDQKLYDCYEVLVNENAIQIKIPWRYRKHMMKLDCNWTILLKARNTLGRCVDVKASNNHDRNKNCIVSLTLTRIYSSRHWSHYHWLVHVPGPSSPRFCWPMRIQFIVKSKDVIYIELLHFKKQITIFQNTRIQNKTFDVSIKHAMSFSIIVWESLQRSNWNIIYSAVV